MSCGSLAEYWLTTLMYKLKIALEPFNEVFVVWGRGHTTNRRGLVASKCGASAPLINRANSTELTAQFKLRLAEECVNCISAGP